MTAMSAPMSERPGRADKDQSPLMAGFDTGLLDLGRAMGALAQWWRVHIYQAGLPARLRSLDVWSTSNILPIQESTVRV